MHANVNRAGPVPATVCGSAPLDYNVPMFKPRQSQSARRVHVPGRPDRAALHEAALRHLSRFAATEAGLLRVLERRIMRWQHAAGESDAAAAPHRAEARAVVQGLVAAGMIDDAGFATARAARLVRAGRSRRAVSAHLAAKGVDAETAGDALPDPAAEFSAAVAFARRRRIGPFAADPEETDDAQRRLAMFARAGFPREIAERVLRLAPDEAASLLAALKRG